MKPQLLIGATASGCGKTTFTLGLLRALRRRGMRVQPFKCGPDYLDTRHHTAAASCESINLDLFFSSPEHLKHLYAHFGAAAEVCVTEGVMGLFDGYDQMRGSSAEVATTLNLPVILLLDAKAAAHSVAATLYGFKNFHPNIHMAGVVFNRVNSLSHYKLLSEACETVGLTPLGYLPFDKTLFIPSRHLGLSIDSEFQQDSFLNRLADQVEKTVNLEALLTACQGDFSEPPIHKAWNVPSNSQNSKTFESNGNWPVNTNPPMRHIAVARDEAFNFCYFENLEILRKLAPTTFFSPLHDTTPPEADLIYLPGGYPELHLKTLSDNQPMREAIAAHCHRGGHLLAECGGMMYLCRKIIDTQGHPYPMVGLFPQDATLENMKLTLGYRTLHFNNQEFRGHEFHYSHLIPNPEMQPFVQPATVTSARGTRTETQLYRYKNTVASYLHCYWGETGKLPF